MAECNCYAVATDTDRIAMWEDVFPEGKVPLRGPLIPEMGWLKDSDYFEYYHLDVERVTDEQKDRLYDHIFRRFGLSRDEFDEDLATDRAPVRAANITVFRCAIHTEPILTP